MPNLKKLVLAAFAAAVVGTPAIASAPGGADPQTFAAVPRFATGRAAPRTLGVLQATQGCRPGPERISPDGHNVSLDMELRRVSASIDNPSERTIVNGVPTVGRDTLELRSYSGCLTSPLVEVLPGQSVRIAFHNELSANDPTCGAATAAYLLLPPGVGCFNTTNVHFHGLHVSPKGISDNVLRTMPPAASPYPVRVDIPANHPAGTFWYHAHMHGSTAIGVSSADAGVLIVRGTRTYADRAKHANVVDIDTVLHGPNKVPFADTVFEFQQIPYGCFLQPAASPSPGAVTGPYDNLLTTKGLYTTADSQANTPPASANAPWTCTNTTGIAGKVTPGVIENFNTQLFSATIWDTNGRFTSINGVVQPKITLAAGAIQRWRFVHAGVHDTINVQVVRMTKLPQSTGSVSTALGNALLGKSRKDQAAVLGKACIATPQTVIPQVEIAVDGLTRTTMNPIYLAQSGVSTVVPKVASNYLQPGYRSDILIAFPSEGDYCLLDQAAPPGERVVVTPSGGINGNGGQGPSIPQLLAYVHVSGGTPVPGGDAGIPNYIAKTIYDGNPELPASVRDGFLRGDTTTFAPFVALDKPAPQLLPAPYAHFEISNTGAFTVNGHAYPIATPSIQPVLVRQLGSTDDWDVRIDPTPAPSGAPNGAEPHIFHIHVNPFEIMDVRKIGYDASGKRTYTSIFDPVTHTCVASHGSALSEQYCGLYHVFRDTLFIENGYDVTLRTRYDVYDGEFVLHCHILDHEDAGMMANVMIAKDRLHPPALTKMIMPAMQMRAAAGSQR